MWGPPAPVIRRVSPALAGRSLTTGPPGKSRELVWCVRPLTAGLHPVTQLARAEGKTALLHLVLSTVSEYFCGCCSFQTVALTWGFLGGSESIRGGFWGFWGGKESIYQCGFDACFGKIPYRRKWQPTPVLLAGKSYGQRILVGYSSWGPKESDMTSCLNNNNGIISMGWFWVGCIGW